MRRKKLNRGRKVLIKLLYTRRSLVILLFLLIKKNKTRRLMIKSPITKNGIHIFSSELALTTSRPCLECSVVKISLSFWFVQSIGFSSGQTPPSDTMSHLQPNDAYINRIINVYYHNLRECMMLLHFHLLEIV